MYYIILYYIILSYIILYIYASINQNFLAWTVRWYPMMLVWNLNVSHAFSILGFYWSHRMKVYSCLTIKARNGPVEQKHFGEKNLSEGKENHSHSMPKTKRSAVPKSKRHLCQKLYISPGLLSFAKQTDLAGGLYILKLLRSQPRVSNPKWHFQLFCRQKHTWIDLIWLP